MIVLVVGRLLLMLALGIFTRTPRTRRAPSRPEPLPSTTREPVVHVPVSPAARAREGLLRVGGGAYLGVRDSREWATADPETAAMILGPPRSGKTSAVMIPALMAACGPAVSTSTKPDVMEATIHARAEIGEVWLFDPSGTEPLPDGVRRLSWSPVSAAATWDGALVTARAMTAASRAGAGTTNEHHWSERAAALLAPLLYAAQLTDRPIEEVLRWTLRQDLAPALEVLADADSEIAADVLVGIERTDARERSSIFSATAGVLSAYNSDGARQSAANPNFDPDQFAAGTDTLYITSPEQHQAALRAADRRPAWSRSATPSTPALAQARLPGRGCCGCWTRSRTSPRSTTSPRSSPKPAGRACRSWSACRTSPRPAPAGARTRPTGSSPSSRRS